MAERTDMQGKTFLPILQGDSNSFKLVSKDDKYQIATNFTANEFYNSRIGRPHYISEDVVACVQIVRSHFGVPIRITSTYRDYVPSVAGAASKSPHMLAQACDFTFSTNQEEKESLLVRMRDDFEKKGSLFQKLWGRGCRGFGVYDTFIHLDTVPVEIYPAFRAKRRSEYQGGLFAFWNNQKVLRGRTVDSGGTLEPANPITVLSEGAKGVVEEVKDVIMGNGVEDGMSSTSAYLLAIGSVFLVAAIIVFLGIKIF